MKIHKYVRVLSMFFLVVTSALVYTRFWTDKPTNQPQENVSSRPSIGDHFISCADGDTCLFTNPNQDRIKVRLIGIDAPETPKSGRPGQAVSQEAWDFVVAQLSSATSIQLNAFGKDQYDRTLAEVYYTSVKSQNQLCLNSELLARGLAWTYLLSKVPSELKFRYIDAEKEARSKKIGVWNPSIEVEPAYIFRRRHRN